MADKKSKEKDADEKSGGSKRIITALVLSVAMLGAGYFVGGMMSGGAAEPVPADAAAAEEEVEETKELGYLVDLEAINVNLEDGAYLRIAVSFELDKELVEKDKKTGEIAFSSAPAADLLLATFSGRTMDELSTASGRDAARATLFDRVYEVYGPQVKGIYFTQFVMQ